MNDDIALLRRYAEEGSQGAFADLVRRHVDLVYGAALRRTHGDPHHAADIAQQVFTRLARDSRRLSRHPVLVAWLHTATRNAALNLMISEKRRQVREHQALDLAPAGAGDAGPNWERLRPVLDAAIDELPEPDRAAVVLRFLERRPFAEIGAALRVSEDAARMRTDRALNKLRTALARHGITSTATALSAIVSSQPLVSAPAGLATALVSESLATAGAGAGLLAAFTAFMNMKIVTTASVSALIFFGIGAYVGLKQTSDTPSPPPPMEDPHDSQILASLRKENLSLKAEIDRLNADIELLDTANAALAAQRAAPAQPAPAQKSVTLGMSVGQRQRAMLNNLRQIAAARDQFVLEYGRPPSSVHDLVGAEHYRMIKYLRTVDGEDYSGLPMTREQPLTVTAPDGTTVTYDPSGANTTRPEISQIEQRAEELEQQRERIDPLVRDAFEAYRAANNGNKPPNPEALIPYFATPQDAADFIEHMEAQKSASR